ncbi:flagellar assembly protein FliX [Pseudorhodoplanes sp.]|uniref:flagellar assembly protein FliX n=1 Tax=Pseudorhodoplanes sp. TaxID=1934341 RepID=UPI00391CE400
MRVLAGSNYTALRDAPALRRSGGGFTLPDTANRATRSGSAPVRSIAGVDVLVALQELDESAERRRRAVKRGRTALDALEMLKLGLLSGTLDGPALERLRQAAADLAGASGEPGLDSVLAEIDLRVQVELAKWSQRGP